MIKSALVGRAGRVARDWARLFFYPPVAELRRIHDALFACFLPGEDIDLPSDIDSDVVAARERLWSQVLENERVQTLLVILSDLRRLHSYALHGLYNRYVAHIPGEPATALRESFSQIVRLLKEIPHGGLSFADLPGEARQRLLQMLRRSPVNFHRRIAVSVQTFYVSGTYAGRVGRKVAGIGDHGEGLLEAAPDVSVPRFRSELRYDSRKGLLLGELDYIIVGSGPSGCVLAHELQSAGKRVLVLESGPFFLPGTYDGRAGLDFYEDRGRRSTADGGIFVLNGCVTGGGSTINADMAFEPTLPTVSYRIRQWHESGQIPRSLWAESEMEAASNWVSEHVGTRQASEEEVNEHNRILFRGALRHGLHPALYKLNTFRSGSSPFLKTDKRDAVSSFLMKALTSSDKPAALIPHAEASRVLIRGGAAKGVEFVVRRPQARAGIIADPFGFDIPDGATVRAQARHVISCGGSLGSTALLLKSGLRNRNIGRGFVLHPFMLIFGTFDQPVDCHLGTPSSIYVDDYVSRSAGPNLPDFMIECASARPEIGALMVPGGGSDIFQIVKQYRYMGGIGILLLDSVNPDNRVLINAAGDVEVRYVLSDGDKARFRRGVAEGVRVMFKAGAKKVILPTWEHIAGGNGNGGGLAFLTDIGQSDLVERSLAFHSNQTFLFAAHMTAGNRIGPGPDVSVLSDDHQVWGVRDLYVVDGSVYPTSVGANPMQMIYSTAKIFADRHLARVGS